MERRVFLAIFLAAIVMYGWQALFVPPPPPPTQTQAKPTPTATQAPPGTPSPQPVPVEAPAAPDTSGPEAGGAAAVVSETGEREIVVETATVQAVLTNRGGRLLHWRLKE